MHYPRLSTELIRSYLLEANINVPQERISFEQRDGRWYSRTLAENIAWTSMALDRMRGNSSRQQ